MTDQDLDPTIAALLAETQADAGPSDDLPSFKDISDSPADKRANEPADSAHKVDLSLTGFKEITKFYEEESNHIFDDKAYYKTALGGEGDQAQRVHKILSKYLTCQDPKDRTVYRQQIVTSWWELIRVMCPKTADRNLEKPKQMLLRFGVVLPSLFTPEQKQLFSTVILNNNTGEPVYYMDEWFKEIATGRLSLSATDEARTPRKNDPGAEAQRIQQLKNKNDGKLQNAESLLNSKETERQMLENELRNRIDSLCEHSPVLGLEPHKQGYTDGQKRLFGEIQEKLRALQKVDKELVGYMKEFEEAKAIGSSLESKMTDQPEAIEVNSGDLMIEFQTVRQMAKMTCGRQGNQFPVFTREFYHCVPRLTGFRENVLNILKWVEDNDPECFVRIHKNAKNRIVPYVLCLPTYGDFGFCWEPFDRYNRVTSRGRIVIPMYPRDLKIAILMAVADLRWQVAKEKASYYWMEEGLTGQYYQWIERQKLKGDLKSYFIADYVLWMTKELDGIQRMDKELRAVFWRFVPFNQAKKDDLKMRSPVYAELYQRDLNRAMSDGY
ncbi:hypothetical protein [Treponema ruminis]|uniref:Uncharacterized protein n=1 Tax=Treponema ruminis TaxID=744515 RepID=A0A7W8G6X8_9SPIR|nr:hypothetical protein [Treponema ruminis]MBB5224892.1 hypothetical protein [Treponema ruminis]